MIDGSSVRYNDIFNRGLATFEMRSFPIINDDRGREGQTESMQGYHRVTRIGPRPLPTSSIYIYIKSCHKPMRSSALSHI